MRVAYLLNQYPMPSQTFVRREMAALEEQGWDIERISIRPTTGESVEAADRAEADRTRVVLGGGARRRLLAAVLRTAAADPARLLAATRLALRLGWGSARGPAVHLAYLAEACVVLRWLRAAGIDHVHSHFGTNAPMVALLVRTLGGPPFSFTVHGPEEFDHPEALRLRDKVRAAAFVVTISSFGRSQLLRWCDHDDWSKVHVVRCGLDPGFIGAEQVPVPGPARLVSIGRLAEQKGQLLLVEAVGRLRRDGVDVELVLGGEGPLREVIEAEIETSGAAGAVEITGWIDSERVQAEVRAARALVMPSFAEGLPVVIMEAFALGRPVVATSIAGIPELVDETCGWVVPAGSVDALTDALRAVLDAPTEQLDRMGATGRDRVIRRHDVGLEAARLAALFEAS